MRSIQSRIYVSVFVCSVAQSATASNHLFASALCGAANRFSANNFSTASECFWNRKHEHVWWITAVVHWGTSIETVFFIFFVRVSSLWHNNSNNWREEKKTTRKSNIFQPKMGFRTKRSLSGVPFESCAQMVCDKCTFARPSVHLANACDRTQDATGWNTACCNMLHAIAGAAHFGCRVLVFVRRLRAASAHEC